MLVSLPSLTVMPTCEQKFSASNLTGKTKLGAEEQSKDVPVGATGLAVGVGVGGKVGL